MINKIDHIGIAVKDLDEAVRFYTEKLGVKVQGFEVVEEQKVKVAFIPLGDAEIELLESTHEDGPIARFIEKNGVGIQHIAFTVDSIKESLAELKKKDVRLIDEVPRYGAGGTKIAFMHPKSTNGILLELTERNISAEK